MVDTGVKSGVDILLPYSSELKDIAVNPHQQNAPPGHSEEALPVPGQQED